MLGKHVVDVDVLGDFLRTEFEIFSFRWIQRCDCGAEKFGCRRYSGLEQFRHRCRSW